MTVVLIRGHVKIQRRRPRVDGDGDKGDTSQERPRGGGSCQMPGGQSREQIRPQSVQEGQSLPAP